MPHVVVSPQVLHHVPGRYVEDLQQAGFEVRYPEVSEPQESDAVVAMLEGAVGVIAGGERYTEEVFERLPGLRSVARFGVGFDKVDVPAATRHGVAVSITPTANHAAVAELTLALIFALAKYTCRHDREVRQGVWSRLPLLPLRGRTLGIVGLGRIGRSVARRAAALEMTVLAAETLPDEEFVRQHGIELVNLDTLLARSDYVSLHVPLADGTRELINRETLEKMKPGSFLVNTARGGLVEEEALCEALASGHLAGAGLDVFAVEPTPTDNPLLAFDNVIAAPHMAGCDELSLQDMAAEAARAIIELSQGRWPAEQIVNPEVRERFAWAEAS